MGAWTEVKCPVEGCSYSATFRLGMGEETNAGALAEHARTLRDEHPAHPVDQASDSAGAATEAAT